MVAPRLPRAPSEAARGADAAAQRSRLARARLRARRAEASTAAKGGLHTRSVPDLGPPLEPAAAWEAEAKPQAVGTPPLGKRAAAQVHSGGGIKDGLFIPALPPRRTGVDEMFGQRRKGRFSQGLARPL